MKNKNFLTSFFPRKSACSLRKSALRRRRGGFTLIELLVVIAIIGILSSVVLASLRSARQKGADAAIKANLANMRPAAELYYEDNNGSYDGLCDAQRPESDGYRAALNLAGGVGQCQDDPDSWAAAVQLSSYWCVDSSGAAREIKVLKFTTKSDDSPLLAAASLAQIKIDPFKIKLGAGPYACPQQ